MAKSVVLQGNDRHGWCTEECSTIDEVKSFLSYMRVSGKYSVWVYIDGQHVHTLFKSKEKTKVTA